MKKQSIRNRFITVSMAVLMLMMTALPAFALSGDSDGDRGRTVRMGFFEFGGMFEGASEGARKSGYCYEYMMHIATYTGWNFEFCYGTYAELYEKLKNGEIDILPYTNYNDQRGREVLFSDKALAEEEYYIAVRSDHPTSQESLKGERITTLQGADYNDLLLDYLTENDLDLEVCYYPNLSETWDAVRSGEAEASVFTSNAYEDDGWNCICAFGKKPTYIAVAQNRPDLLAQLNEATALIDIDNPALLGELYAVYFSDNPMRRSLAPEEKAWLAEHPVLHVGGFVNDAPYLYTVDNAAKTATGLTVDVTNGIVERLDLGITVDYRGYQTLAEMEAALDSGEIDVIIPFYPDSYVAQQHGLIISKTVRVSNMEIVYTKDLTYQEALTRIATPATKLGIYYVRDIFPQSEIVDAVSIQDAVDKVLNGEATGAIAQNVVLHNIKEKYDNLNYVVLSEGCGTCYATGPENYALIRILNRGLNYFSSAEISAIASQYNLEPNVTTKAYLATHTEAVVLLAALFAVLVFLAVALVQVNHLKQKADEANQSKTRFLFNMSHDIRTPMNAITGFTDKAIRHRDDPEVLEASLEKIRSSSAYLLRIINDILDMAKIESGKLELAETVSSTEKKHNALLEMFAGEAMKKGIDLHTSYDVQDRYLWIDESRMSQILANLLSNAIKYTDAGGRIWYSCKQVPCSREGYGRFEITVRDTGRGMSPEFLKRIFDSFEREESAIRSGAQGTGLGMAIVKRLADAMGATVDIRSELGKGTEITFTVEHRIATAEEVEAAFGAAGKSDADSQESFAGKRILLVEDNKLNREIATDLLTDEGLLVETAEDGHLAVERIRDLAERHDYRYYDAVLMDVQMPTMDGYEATREIRKIPFPEGVHLPIIAMTANAFEEDRQNAFNAGMDDHIAKPIDVQRFFETLAKFL